MDTEPPRMLIDSHTWVLALTGAGVSAESGLSTFRAAGGLWENHPVEKVATPQGFEEDPQLVWRFYSARRARARETQPNPGHVALVRLEERLGDQFLLVTQNVDGLHARAGSRRIVEIHGNLFESRCTRCDRPPFHDEQTCDDQLPWCDHCQSKGRKGLLRPNVVWFGELLDPKHLQRIDAFIVRGSRQRLVFLAAGTSGAVYPAAGLVDRARAVGGETWLVNADPADNTHRFHRFIQGRSGEVLPALWEWVQG